MMNNLKDLVEKIVEYTKTWSITESEWYWNINSVRKSDTYENGKALEDITWEEFEVAIREEILYDLVFNNGRSVAQQLENDYECYELPYDNFEKSSIELEKEIRKYIADFKVSRLDENNNVYYI